MIRIRQIKIDINKDRIDNVLKVICFKLHIKKEDILSYIIKDKSIDARRKPNIYYIYTVDIEVLNEEKVLSNNNDINILYVDKEEYIFNITGIKKLNKRPIIVGSGPSGLFCAYLLAENGYKPIIIERGKKIEERVVDVEKFFETGILDLNSNVQFGEGGAGTFSDGKLVSQIKDKNCRKKKVFDTFIMCGADESIGYINKPHIGTDVLRKVIINMRNKIINMGGTFMYNTCFTNIKYSDHIEAIEINNKEWLDTDVLVLALGHSARDTFKMLYENKISMEAKPFAVGIRIQHPQKWINKNQYGTNSIDKLGAASYKLTYKAHNGRGVYSFCMCPGGYVVNASSENNMLVVNGMSNHARDSVNANSALIVTISPKDFGNHPLDGIKFQRKLEKKAYDIGHGQIPTQRYADYKNNQQTKKIGDVKPIMKGDHTLCNINDIFPNYINESLKEAIEYFGKQINNYNNDDALICAVESRTSSPLKILRSENYETNIKGIYPIGEGAGYAGGITSASIDGIKVAEEIAKVYGEFNE